MTKTLETPREMLGRGTLFAGRYEVIEALGVGGMGEVYRVEDKKVGQEVALKLIKPKIATNKKTIDRFRHELNMARMILKCMKKGKEHRYQNAEELFSELKKIEGEIPTTEKIRAEKIVAEETVRRLKWKKVSLYAAASLILMMVICAGVYLLTKRESPIDSIAVLPFDSKNANSEMEYISEGLTESLISTLSKLPRLKVISRFSVFQYKGKKYDPQDVGKELNVKAILTGTVAQRGDSLSIITELIDVKDKTRLWGEQYNRKLADIFVFQEEISKDISAKLRLRLSGEEKKALVKRYTENAEAYRLYLQGRFYWNRRTPIDLQKAITYFEKAVAMDPQFSLGYASLAETYVAIGNLTFQPPEAVYPKAEDFCLKALLLDEELAEAHSALGAIKGVWKWDFEGAEKEYRRAIELDPNNATAHQRLEGFYLMMNRTQLALKEIHIAQELDPHAISMLWMIQ